MSTPSDALPDLLKEKRSSRPVWRRVLFAVLAVVCFVLGFVGWLVPVVTGIPFYLAALVFLALASDRAVGWFNRVERRLPLKWRKKLRRALARMPRKRTEKWLNLPEAPA